MMQMIIWLFLFRGQQFKQTPDFPQGTFFIQSSLLHLRGIPASRGVGWGVLESCSSFLVINPSLVVPSVMGCAAGLIRVTQNWKQLDQKWNKKSLGTTARKSL